MLSTIEFTGLMDLFLLFFATEKRDVRELILEKENTGILSLLPLDFIQIFKTFYRKS
jgi:hypothetical protein